MKIPAYISAGGKSSRFGSDKARAVFLGEPLIIRTARLISPLCESVTVVAGSTEQYSDLHLHTVADLHPGGGPMSALETALSLIAHDSWLMFISCDWAFLQPEWIDKLVSSIQPGLQAVAYRHQFWEPLLAIYHASLLSQVQQRVVSQQRSLQSLLHAINTHALPLPADWPQFPQINTPEDLRLAEAEYTHRQTKTWSQ